MEWTNLEDKEIMMVAILTIMKLQTCFYKADQVVVASNSMPHMSLIPLATSCDKYNQDLDFVLNYELLGKK